MGWGGGSVTVRGIMSFVSEYAITPIYTIFKVFLPSFFQGRPSLLNGQERNGFPDRPLNKG